MTDKKKILMIRTDWSQNEYRIKTDGYGGIGYYRIVKPGEFLSEFYDVDIIGGKGFNALGDTQEARMRAIFEKYDLVFVRQIDNPRAASDLIAAGRYFGVPVILDMDDNLLELRADNPAFEQYGPGTDRFYILKTVIELVDGMTVSTEPLKKAYAKLQKKITILPNFNDVADWPQERMRFEDGLIRIGWAGSITHDADLVMVIEPLKKIFAKYPHVRFEILGGVPREKIQGFLDKFAPYQDRIKFFAGTPSWEGYPKLLADTGWDIALVPLVDDKFNRSKSHIKWMEMSMLQIPVVASKTYPYYKNVGKLKTIEHGKTGFLASSEKDWVKYLSALIDSSDLRTRIGYNAYDYIRANWQWKFNAWRWKEVFDSYLK